MNTVIVIIVVIVAVLEIVTAVNSYRYGLKYMPVVVSIINTIRLSKDLEAYMRYCYGLVVNPDKYLKSLERYAIKNGAAPDYADSIIEITRKMIAKYNNE